MTPGVRLKETVASRARENSNVISKLDIDAHIYAFPQCQNLLTSSKFTRWDGFVSSNLTSSPHLSSPLITLAGANIGIQILIFDINFQITHCTQQYISTCVCV